jgi:SAM-dependent methyltransferase
MKDKYCFDIPEGGSKGLSLLDYCFNNTTKEFLLSSGLAPGMKVLEIGCGSGEMSCWIAQVIGSGGQLIAIDNNENQLNSAEKLAKNKKIKNITFEELDAYDIANLNTRFDFVYCRFVLHHLTSPRSVIKTIYSLLKEGGVAAIEEGIVNHAFVYPYNIAFGNERFKHLSHHENTEGKSRDGNFGIQLYYSLTEASFSNLNAKIVAPVLTTKDEKRLLKPGFLEGKTNSLQNGETEKEWQGKLTELDKLIADDKVIIGFYQSMQVSGVKTG